MTDQAGRDSDRKAEELCGRLNAAWKELGPIIHELRKQRDDAMDKLLLVGKSRQPCVPGCAHVCLEEVFRSERDQARRDLDRKDHEYAELKATNP